MEAGFYNRGPWGTAGCSSVPGRAGARASLMLASRSEEFPDRRKGQKHSQAYQKRGNGVHPPRLNVAALPAAVQRRPPDRPSVRQISCDPILRRQVRTGLGRRIDRLR